MSGKELQYDLRNGPLLDPDPFSLFLIWLGATGSVASLVGVFEQFHGRIEVRRRDEKEHRELVEAMSQLESDLTQLGAQLSKMDILLRLAGAGTVNGHPMMTPATIAAVPFKFGAIQLHLPPEMLREWYRFHRETCTLAARVGRSVHKLILLLDGGHVRVRSETHHLFGKLGEELNKVVDSETFASAVKQCGVAIEIGKSASENLRNDVFGG